MAYRFGGDYPHSENYDPMVGTMNYARSSASLVEDELVDPRAVWRGLRRRLPLIAGIFGVVFLTVAVYTLTAEELYTAEATMRIESGSRGVVEDDPYQAQNVTSSQVVDTEVELLRSRAMTVGVARRLGVELAGGDGTVLKPRKRSSADAISDAIVRNAETLEADVTAEGQQASVEVAPVVEEEIVPVPNEVVLRMRSRLEIDRVGSTQMISVRYSSPSPETSAVIANAYIEEYITQQLESRADALRQANRWIDARLGVLREEVRDSEEAAARYRVENRLIDAPQGTTIVQQRITETVSELTEQRALLSSYEARYDSLRRLQGQNIPLESIPEVMSSPTIRDLRGQQAIIARNKAELRVRYGDKHPDVKKIIQEGLDLQIQIDNEVARIVNSLRSEIAVTENRIRLLEQTLTNLQEESAQLNPAQVRLQELERDTIASRGRYEALLNRQKELHEREGLIEADARVISNAEPPDSPSRPRRKILLAGGMILALILAASTAFVVEVADTRIKNTADMRREFGHGVPVVLVPIVRNKRWFRAQSAEQISQQYVVNKPSSIFSESLREIHANLIEAFDGEVKKPLSVAFTSGQEGEGASTIAYCFASFLANSGNKVVFLDCDRVNSTDWTKSGESEDELGSDDPFVIGPEAREMLTSSDNSIESDDSDEAQGPIAKIARAFGSREVGPRETSSIAHLSVAFPNGDPNNMANALAQGRFDTFISSLESKYDYIVINVRPLMSASESTLICARSDATFLVAEWLVATREAARIASQRLADARASLVGYVISKVDHRQRFYFGPEDRSFFFQRAWKKHVSN